MPKDKPCQKFNLVVYYDKGIRLTVPLFYENVYIYNGDHYLYASDVAKFDKYNDEEDEDPIVEMMYKVIETTFSYIGIHVVGLDMGTNKKKQTTFFYQSWLVTNLTRAELEKEHWHGY